MDSAVRREVGNGVGLRASGSTGPAIGQQTVAPSRAPRDRGQRPAVSAHRFGRSYQSCGLVGMSRSQTRWCQLRGREKEERRGQFCGDGGRDCAGVCAGQSTTLLVHGMLCAVIAAGIRRSFLATRLGRARHIHARHSGRATLVTCGLSRLGGHRADEQGHHGQNGEHEAHRLQAIQARWLKSTVRLPVSWTKRCRTACKKRYRKRRRDWGGEAKMVGRTPEATDQ